MKQLNYLLLPAIATVVVLIGTSNAQANTNGVIFPPANATGINNYQYPPQYPVAPSFNRAPTQNPYVFGQQPQMRAPAQRPPMGYYNGMTPQQPARPPVRFQNRAAPPYPMNRGNNNNSFPFSNGMPFGNNSNNSFNPLSNGNMPFSGNSFGMPSNPMNSFFGNNNNGSLPFFNQGNKNRKKAWGDERNIWPDFYTDFTDEAWDTAMSGPRDLGTMPGGWRFPYISMPDPVTVSDAITNQFPPIAEEAGNMADFSDWGVFDDK